MRSLTFLAIGVLGAMMHYSEAAVSQKKMEDMMKAIMDCALREQAMHYDLDELFAHMPPSTRTGGCLHACIMQSFGLFENNKLKVSAFVEMGRMKHNYDPIKVRIVHDIANECAEITDPDRCESAAKIRRCLHKGASSRHLTFDV